MLARYLRRIGIKLDDKMWAEIKKAVRLIDTKEELDELIANPEAFVDRLVRIQGSHTGPTS